MKRAARLFPFAALFAAALAVQSFVVLTSRIPRNADQAVACLIAKHIVDGGGHPVFFYGSTYGGTVEPHFMAVLFAVFGASPEVYRAGLVVLLGLTICGVTAIAWRAFGERAAIGTLGFLALSPFYFLYKELTSDGVYAPVTLSAVGVAAGSVLALEAQSPDGKRTPPWLPALLVGLAGGIGFWVSPGTLPVTVIGVGALAWRRWDRAALRSFLVFIPSFLAGSVPWWIWNLRHSWQSVRSADVARADAAGVLRNLKDFFVFSFPILTGTAAVNDELSLSPFPLARVLAAAAFGVVLLLASREGAGRRTAGFLVLALAGLVLATTLSARFSRYEPRLAIAWYVFFAPLVGAALAGLWEKKRFAAVLLGSTFLVVDLSGVAFAKRHVYIRDRWEVTASIEPLLKRLAELDVHALYADYWTAYRIAFESGEKITATPLAGEEMVRYEPYRRIVDASPSPAFVILPPRERAFEKYLSELHVPYRRESVQAFGIFTAIPESVIALVHRAQALPLPAEAYRVAWLDVPRPATVPAGQPLSILVRVRNASPFLWSPAVHLGYTISPAGSAPDNAIASGSGYPNQWISPGMSVDVPVTLAIPPAPGSYRLVYDLVFENVAWFADRGGLPCIVPLEVH